jgi:hypothetical protein
MSRVQASIEASESRCSPGVRHSLASSALCPRAVEVAPVMKRRRVNQSVVFDHAAVAVDHITALRSSGR